MLTVRVDSHRDNWVAFIKGPKSPSRYLWLGKQATYETQTDVDTDSLSEFLSRLRAREGDYELLLMLRFLLLPKVREFIQKEARWLIRAAPHSTSADRITTRALSGGKVRWPLTLRQRASGRIDTGQYVVERVSRDYDTPENRLTKRILLAAVRTADQCIELLGTNAVLPEILHLRREAESLLKEPYLKDVEIVETFSTRERATIRRNRQSLYRGLLALDEFYNQAITANENDAAIELIRSGWFQPIDSDKLFEVYCLFLTIDIIEKDCLIGLPREYGLIRAGRGSVATFSIPNTNVSLDIFFDQSPTRTIGIQSLYKKIMNAHGLSGSAHRPDITLTLSDNEKVIGVLLLEMKKTDDDRYRRDSIYKVLGYIKDFEDLWGRSGFLPNAILLLPNESPKLTDECLPLEIRVVGGYDRETLSKIISRFLNVCQSTT